jgi:hypothetical protein
MWNREHNDNNIVLCHTITTKRPTQVSHCWWLLSVGVGSSFITRVKTRQTAAYSNRGAARCVVGFPTPNHSIQCGHAHPFPTPSEDNRPENIAPLQLTQKQINNKPTTSMLQHEPLLRTVFSESLIMSII